MSRTLVLGPLLRWVGKTEATIWVETDGPCEVEGGTRPCAPRPQGGFHHGTYIGSLSPMLHREYEGQVCSVARALEIVGERWTILIIRDAFVGLTRFDEFQESLGIARNVLATRLQRLCEEGVLEQHLYQERPKRYEYRLTAKGADLFPVIATLLNWGDRYYARKGPPRLLEHRDCGGGVTESLTCSKCGEPLRGEHVLTRPGPGAGRRRGTRTAVAA